MANRLNDPTYLAGHWPLNSHAQDVSGHGNHGTWTAEAYAENNHGRSAGDFDGASSFITIGDIPSLDFATTDFSWALWVKLDPSISQFDTLVAKRDGNNAGYRIDARSTTKVSLTLEDADGTSVTMPSDDNMNDGLWHHITFAVDAGVTIRMYVDGVAQAFEPNLAALGDISNDASLIFGAHSELGSQFYGGMSDVRAYNVALTEAEALALYRMGVPKQTVPLLVQPNVPDDTLVVWSGITDVRDLSGNGNDGTPSGGVVLGTGMALDGSDGAVSYGNVGSIAEVAMWVKTASANEALIGTSADARTSIFVSAGNLGTVTLAGLNCFVNGVDTDSLATGIWQHVVCSFNAFSANPLRVGNDGETEYGEIEVRDLQVRTAARSADAIVLDYLRTRKYH